MADGIRLGDVVQTELEQLESYGEAAQEFFVSLTADIKQEFSASLNDLLTTEMANFQTQVSRSLMGGTDTGSQLGSLFGNLAGDVIGGLLPDSLFGDVYGAAISGAVRTAVRDVVRNGSFDLGRVVKSANSSGASVLNRSIDMSKSQRSAEALTTLNRGQRNL